MSDDQVAVILTKDVRDTRLDMDSLLVIGAEDGLSGLGARGSSPPTSTSDHLR